MRRAGGEAAALFRNAHVDNIYIVDSLRGCSHTENMGGNHRGSSEMDRVIQRSKVMENTEKYQAEIGTNRAENQDENDVKCSLNHIKLVCLCHD